LPLEAKNGVPWQVTTLPAITILSTVTGGLLYNFSGPSASWDLISLLSVVTVIFALLCGALSSPRTYHRRVAFLLWWILLTSEEVFSRWSTSENALQNRFSFAAYSEAFIWFTVLIAMVIYTLGDAGYLRTIWSGPTRLLLTFAFVCLFSCAYTPQPLFALAWAFKLLLVVFVIQACRDHFVTAEDISLFFRVTLWAYAFLAILPLLRVLPDPSIAFEEGRLSKIASPTGLGASAGNLFLLALVFYYPLKARLSIVLAGLGLSILIFSGGKTGIASAIFSAVFFFVLQKKFGSVMRLIGSIAIVAAGIVLTTPVAGYFEMYGESGQAATISGRLPLWSAALPSILRSPILGHGFMSSRFVAIDIGGIPWDAGHMHNGFLEALYNDGIVGLILIVLMHAIILKNFVFLICRHSLIEPKTFRICAGCLAIYANLLINGMFNASFGGRPEASFMTLMALVIVSDVLATLKLPTQVLDRAP
jgi:O-antigen ligase